MISHTLPYDDRHELLRRWRLGSSVLRILWQGVRLPVLALLIVLEPFVSLILTAFGFLATPKPVDKSSIHHIGLLQGRVMTALRNND